ncbi:MAG: tetratricopeptide repeat protein [Isosphaeraceae bacterium]
MDRAPTSLSAPRTPRNLRVRRLAAVSTLVGTSVALLVWQTSRNNYGHRAVAGSPYLNTQPGVKHVGDSACLRCHAEIGETYFRHPMGRSLSPVASALAAGSGPSRFEAQGLQYSVEAEAGRVIHKEERRDASGRIVAQTQAEVRYVLGSGKQAIAYLIDRGGFLFESPITWYIRERRWGLSPGYEERNRHFNRPILADCLFCHANRVERVAGTVNRYREPIFHGHAIGCKRCHGPGELHVRRPALTDGVDLTIVNPARLAPSLRDAVCEQCHLIGRRRSVHAGLQSEDYRPGLPFTGFWSAFVTPPGDVGNRFGGQVEQMHESRCFRDSQGRLGCISCHDPHEVLAKQDKAAYFRDRCLACHADRGCSLPVKVRLERDRGDDCTICHMPQSGTSNNPHLATTNHRVPRDDASSTETLIQDRLTPGQLRALVNFHDDLLDDRGRADSRRDLGIALAHDGREGASLALPLLEAALASMPDDPPAWEGKGDALATLGRAEDGLRAYLVAIAKDPTRETAVTGAASLAFRAGRRQEALDYWRRAIAINPWRSDYRAELARVAMRTGDWRAATRSCQDSLRLNPTATEVRKWLVQCHLKQGDLAAARREFEILMGFDPPDREALLRWFDAQSPIR